MGCGGSKTNEEVVPTEAPEAGPLEYDKIMARLMKEEEEAEEAFAEVRETLEGLDDEDFLTWTRSLKRVPETAEGKAVEKRVADIYLRVEANRRAQSDNTSDEQRGAALARIHAVCAAHYTDFDGLLDTIASGAIAPLRGRWLIALCLRGGRIARRQDLPPEAFWTADELRRYVIALGKDRAGYLFVALSYRWLTRLHPDPDAFHLTRVAETLELFLAPRHWSEAGHSAPAYLARAFVDAGLADPPDCAVFWDFGSLFQGAAEESRERALFTAGLRASNMWYGHMRSVVWMQSELPDDFEGSNYMSSGWCFVERCTSGLRMDIHGAQRLLDLSLRGDASPRYCWNGGIELNCCASPMAPRTPEDMRMILEEEKVFTNKSDVTAVAQIYQTVFEHASADVTQLLFGFDTKSEWWPLSEVRYAIAAVPAYRHLQQLQFKYMPEFGDDAAFCLSQALRHGHPALRYLHIYGCPVADEGVLAIAKTLNTQTVQTAFPHFMSADVDAAEGTSTNKETKTAMEHAGYTLLHSHGKLFTQAFPHFMSADVDAAEGTSTNKKTKTAMEHAGYTLLHAYRKLFTKTSCLSGKRVRWVLSSDLAC